MDGKANRNLYISRSREKKNTHYLRLTYKKSPEILSDTEKINTVTKFNSLKKLQIIKENEHDKIQTDRQGPGSQQWLPPKGNTVKRKSSMALNFFKKYQKKRKKDNPNNFFGSLVFKAIDKVLSQEVKSNTT